MKPDKETEMQMRNFSQLHFLRYHTTLPVLLTAKWQFLSSPSIVWTASLGCSLDFSLFLIIVSCFYFLYYFAPVKENCKVLPLCCLQVAEQYHQGLCAPRNHRGPLWLANLFNLEAPFCNVLPMPVVYSCINNEEQLKVSLLLHL